MWFIRNILDYLKLIRALVEFLGSTPTTTVIPTVPAKPTVISPSTDKPSSGELYYYCCLISFLYLALSHEIIVGIVILLVLIIIVMLTIIIFLIYKGEYKTVMSCAINTAGVCSISLQ